MDDRHPGICPICQSGDIAYDDAHLVEDGLAFPWECEYCHARGEEVYDMACEENPHIRGYVITM